MSRALHSEGREQTPEVENVGGEGLAMIRGFESGSRCEGQA